MLRRSDTTGRRSPVGGWAVKHWEAWLRASRLRADWPPGASARSCATRISGPLRRIARVIVRRISAETSDAEPVARSNQSLPMSSTSTHRPRSLRTCGVRGMLTPDGLGSVKPSVRSSSRPARCGSRARLWRRLGLVRRRGRLTVLLTTRKEAVQRAT